MVSLLLSFPATGLTEILVHGRILMAWRARRAGLTADLFNCSQCCGFHAGWVVWVAATLPLLLADLTPYNAFNWLGGAFLTAFTTSALAFAYDVKIINALK